MDINFKSQSKRIGILGASGCGKSMTLKSIAGIETPDSGHIKIDGNILFDKETKTNLKTQKRKVGYLFQNYALFPTMTVEQNIAAGLKGNKQDIHKRVKEMIQKVGLAGLENIIQSSFPEDSSKERRLLGLWLMNRKLFY